ncbi:MAG: M50 family metallopeptidase [Planctomycetota bacterium]|jgi:Zn-dependent protease
MFSRRFKILTAFGFPIYLDLSWFVIAVLITWSLATYVFPQWQEGLTTPTYWAMGVAGAIGLFVSIVLHELGHSLVARRFGLQMKGITLFIFGGVAEMTDEPPSPKAEFVVAAAGPLVSLALGAAFSAASVLAVAADLPLSVSGVAAYLGLINFILVAFNVLPAFPLDGGRMFRALLWRLKDDLRWATRITSEVGSWFGLGFIALGVVTFIGGGFIGGMWWFLIGLFLRQAAQGSYQQLLIRRALEGEPVRRFMQSEPVTVPPEITIRQFIDEYVYRHYFKMYPVTRNDDLVGCVTLRQIKDVPREDWAVRTIGDLAHPCAAENMVSADSDALAALGRMNRSGASRLMVVDEGGRLVGVLALKDLAQFLSARIDLEER